MSPHVRWFSSTSLKDDHPHRYKHQVDENVAPRIPRRIRNRRQPPPISVIGIKIHPLQFLPFLLILLLPFTAALKKAQLLLQSLSYTPPAISFSIFWGFGLIVLFRV